MDQSQKRALLSCMLGNIICWYDFIIFGMATALVFSKLFFPEMSFLIPMLVFAVGFLSRPLGSIVFGYLGDRYGRKATLFMTLLLTGGASVLIGLLPTYQDIGITAAVLLVALRILQTFALGGEWAAASTMTLEFNLQNKSRGFIGSFLSATMTISSLLAAGAWALASSQGNEWLMEWGWRIPFLLSVVLVAIGVYVRTKVIETPVFAQIKEQQAQTANPLKTLIVHHWRKVLVAAAAHHVGAAWWYGITIFGFAYLANNNLMTRPEITSTWMYFSPLIIASVLFFGWVGDKIGRAHTYAIVGLASAVLTYPIFSFLQSGNLIVTVLLGITFIQAMNYASMPTYLTEMFPSELRQIGSGVTNSVASMFAGGIVPLIAQYLVSVNGQNIMVVAHLFLVLSLLQLTAAWHIKKNAQYYTA